jgi:hypothetical protein
MTTYSTQVFSLFGGGYVHEQRATGDGDLGQSDGVVMSLTLEMFQALLASLRSALSVK